MSDPVAAQKGTLIVGQFRKAPPASEQFGEDMDTTLYWRLKAQQLARIKDVDHGLFKGCSTMLGEPLSKDSKSKILSYLNDPNMAAWLQIRSIVVADIITLWQAWLAVDDDAPYVDGDEFPHPDVLRQAIPNAVKQRRETVERQLMAAR